MKIKQLLILSAAALSLAACGEHTHSFGEAWKSDETSHWHECECGEKSGKADHLDTNADGKCDACNHEMEVPSPAGTEVTKEEWEAAFGSEKPFLFADNYKLNMLLKVNGVDVGEENFYADGNKLKDEPIKAPEGETLGSESYYSFENSKYIAYQLTGGKWSTHETSYTPIHDIIETSLAPFVDSDLFTYDETSKFYKCETTTIVAWDVTYTNLKIKFVDKKITEASFTVEGVEDYICTLTYGGQTVTLPEDISQPSVNEVAPSEWEAAFGLEKPFLFADNYKFNTLVKENGVELAENNFYADGNKLKYERVKVPQGETYYLFENSKYIAYQFTEGKWSTDEKSNTPVHDIIETTLEPFLNPYLFTYDETSKFYKCETTTIPSLDATFTNLEIKFVDKKITEIIFNIQSYDYIYTLTYGGQTVTLPEVEPEHSGEGNNYSQILKDAATEIMQFNAAPAVPSRGFAPQEAPGQALAFPAVYLYWAGLLNDIQGVNVVEQAIQSSGTYKFNGMGGNIQSITFDLNVNFDEANNKFTFLGRQDLPGTSAHSYLVLTCDYNFTSNQLGDFSVLMVPDNNTYGNYMRVKNGVFEMYNYSSDSHDAHATDPDFIEYNAIFEAGRAILDAKMETENVLEGAALTASQEALVAACDYCDDITTGTDFDVEIYTGEE